MTKPSTLDIKICGLKSAEAVHAVIDGGASHVGFIFFEKSPRHIEPGQAATLCEAARDRARVVAVTVNADDDMLAGIVDTVRPDMLQLHGSESIERVQAIKQKFTLPVMKAFAIRDAADLEKARAFAPHIDRLLFDAKPPEGSELPGGNGVSFDWALLRGFDAGVPYMLSGGLDADNIVKAITIARPDGIDISSGVETSPGVKDIKLISNFLQVVKNATADTIT